MLFAGDGCGEIECLGVWHGLQGLVELKCPSFICDYDQKGLSIAWKEV